MAQEAGAAPARPSPAPSSLGSKSGQDVPPSEPDLEGFSGDEKNGRVQHGLSMAQRIMHSLSGTVASFTGTRQQQLVTHYSSVAALSGETADELCAKPTSWLEGDVVLANVSVAKIVGDTVFVSRSETALYKYFVRHHLSVKACNELLSVVMHPDFDPLTVRFKAVESWHSRMAVMNQYGIQYKNMRDETIDGAQDVHFYYRPAWKIVEGMLASSVFAPHLLFGYQPDMDPANPSDFSARRFGEFVSADWMKEATALYPDPEDTLIAVFMGSDATKIKNRGSAHPFYLSLGNFCNWFRRLGVAWRLCGMVPQLDHALMREVKKGVVGTRQASRSARARRERQLFLDCAWLILKSLVDVVNEGGRHVLCGDGKVYKFLTILAAWLTDRMEHELIVGSHPHNCYHCAVPQHLKDCQTDARLLDSADVQEQIETAITTGQYGGDVWREKYAPSSTSGLPILGTETWPDGSVHTDMVQSWERYDHCSSTTGFRADRNPLHQLPHCNLNQVCMYIHI